MKLEQFIHGNVTTDNWFGYTRYLFELDGHKAWIVEPRQAASGNPWAWCMEWPTAFVERIGVIELVERGFHYLHVGIYGTFASPGGIQILNQLYDLAQKIGLNSKAALIGLSMGGFYSYRYAATHPERVALIYADNPLCNLLTYLKMPERWSILKQAYGMNDEEILNWTGNPVDNLAPLAQAGIPLLHIAGTIDEIVPIEYNTDIIERRYRELGGNITVIRRLYCGHHPHGHDDTSIAINFIINNCK